MEVRRLIENKMDGAGNSVGYTMMWQTIHTKYHTNASIALVQRLVNNIDPVGVRCKAMTVFKTSSIF